MKMFKTMRYLATTNDSWAKHFSFQRLICFNYTVAAGFYGWILLPFGRSIAWNVDAEEGDYEVARWGVFNYCRPETDEEKQDRLEGEAEAAWEAYQAEWYSY